MTHEIRNTREAIDGMTPEQLRAALDEQAAQNGQPLKSERAINLLPHDAPEPQWPKEGEFMPDRPLADALEHHLGPLRRERSWCGNFRAEPRIVMAIHELETAIALLRTERHR